jgi:hypothetical protein
VACRVSLCFACELNVFHKVSAVCHFTPYALTNHVITDTNPVIVEKMAHKTTDIVLKHYFQPGREDFRQALQSAMPKLLTNGHKSPKDEMREVIEKLTAKNLKKSKARPLALLAKA